MTENQTSPEDAALKDAHVNKLVGFGALLRIKRQVDDWEQHERDKAHLARGLFIVIGLLIMLIAGLSLSSGGLMQSLVRNITQLFR